MELAKSIYNYYKSPDKAMQISEQFYDYITKNFNITEEISKRITSDKNNKKTAILISGISGSTKTFFSELLYSFLDHYSLIHLDCFAIPKEKRDNKSTFLPENFDFDSVIDSLDSLLIGQDTNIPLYCHEDATYVPNIIHPAQSYILEGIHSHNPRLVDYFRKNGFEMVKIAILADLNYLKDFTRRSSPPPIDIARKRLEEYRTLVQPHSKDADIRLNIEKNHIISQRE